MFPVPDPAARDPVLAILNAYFRDTVKARVLLPSDSGSADRGAGAGFLLRPGMAVGIRKDAIQGEFRRRGQGAFRAKARAVNGPGFRRRGRVRRGHPGRRGGFPGEDLAAEEAAVVRIVGLPNAGKAPCTTPLPDRTALWPIIRTPRWIPNGSSGGRGSVRTVCGRTGGGRLAPESEEALLLLRRLRKERTDVLVFAADARRLEAGWPLLGVSYP
jgi:hypothetical protein